MNSRFWSRVAPPNENGCRLWTGPLRKDGHGGWLITEVGRAALLLEKP